jgi:hypothetical protein
MRKICPAFLVPSICASAMRGAGGAGRAYVKEKFLLRVYL